MVYIVTQMICVLIFTRFNNQTMKTAYRKSGYLEPLIWALMLDFLKNLVHYIFHSTSTELLGKFLLCCQHEIYAKDNFDFLRVTFQICLIFFVSYRHGYYQCRQGYFEDYFLLLNYSFGFIFKSGDLSIQVKYFVLIISKLLSICKLNFKIGLLFL